jgi:hypothetical protein
MAEHQHLLAGVDQWANGLAHGGDLRVGAASADLQRASI